MDAWMVSLSHAGAGSPCSRLAVVAGLALFLGLVGAATVRAQEPSVKQEPIPDDIWNRMQGSSWHATRRCPARNDLALLTVPYLDFNGQPRTGQLIVAKSVAGTVAGAFMDIFRSGKFRIEKMNLIDNYSVRDVKGKAVREASDDESMKDSNTSAFNCRFKSGSMELSAHAKGIAIDINPVQNPFISRSGKVFPKEGSNYDEERERTGDIVGIIVDGDVVTKAFRDRKWTWGADWKSSTDYQHFSADGQ
jgi:poly-gamma-glutamate synthesis protein (capsule biosynthesis protein)